MKNILTTLLSEEPAGLATLTAFTSAQTKHNIIIAEESYDYCIDFKNPISFHGVN